MPFSEISDTTRLERLRPPAGPVRMVLDTDTYNETDDQFALVHAMLSPERLTVEAIYAAPFHNERSDGPGHGMELSYQQILRLLERLGRSAEGFAFRGSTGYLGCGGQPREADAVRDLVTRGLAGPDDDPLYVVAIGAITNVASALLTEPALAEKIVVVWLGGHALSWPDTREFNLRQDVPAARVVLDCGVPLVLVPCMGVTSHLHTSVPEIDRHVAPHGELGAFLASRFKEMRDDHFAWSKVLWDVATIAWLLDPAWVPTELVPSPVVTDQVTWSVDRRRHLIRCASFVHAIRSFATCSANSPPLPSSPWRNSDCIRTALHPGWLRCSSLTYTPICSFLAPCQPGASPLSEHAVDTGGDNHLWREGGSYYLVRPVYGKTTVLEILRSRDMARWESLGSYLEDGHYTDPGTDCSCPNVLSVGSGKHLVLFFSHNQGPKYYVGTSDLQAGRFIIEEHGRMSYGPVMRGGLHAPSGFVDPNGRCIALWNIFECAVNEEFNGSKNGVMSLPRRLSLSDQSTGRGFDQRELHPLCIEPIEELEKLRCGGARVENLPIPENGERIVDDVRGRALELEATIDPRNASEVGLRVLRSPGGEEQRTISVFMHAWAWPWKSNKRELMIDVSGASLSADVAARSPEIGPLYVEDGEPLRLRVFVDRSIIDVFANSRQCLTLRAYPTRQDSTGVSVFARGGDAQLVSLVAYHMKSIWPELRSQERR